MKNLIFFDFDGVIVDTFSFCYEISNSLAPVSEDSYRARFEGNINHALAKANQKSNSSQFFDAYTLRLRDCSPHKEIAEAIKALSLNYVLIIISSTISSPIASFLETHGLRSYFQEILGNDIEKDKTKKMQMMLSKYSTEPTEAIFITDTLGDIEEGKKCGVKSIAVTWGYHPIETLKKGEPYKIISEQHELIDAIKEYFID